MCGTGYVNVHHYSNLFVVLSHDIMLYILNIHSNIYLEKRKTAQCIHTSPFTPDLYLCFPQIAAKYKHTANELVFVRKTQGALMS